MKRTPSLETIAISQLLLDTSNPRLPDIQKSQQDAIRVMTRAQGEKIVTLAEHLVGNGPNPASLSIVMPASDDEEMYYVLDGNRRITALKLLEAPTLAEGILQGAELRRLRQSAAQFEQNPIAQLHCVVVADRDESDIWIPLIHRGQQQGAGLVEWDGQVAARYDARRSKKPTTAALQVLDFVKERASLSNETLRRIEDGKFPITSLSRLINTPYVRNKLGLEISGGNVMTIYPEGEVLKGLTRVVEDLGSGTTTVSDIKKQKQRIDYINGLGTLELSDATKVLDRKYPLGLSPREGTSRGTGTRSRPQGRPTRARSSLIPADCKLVIAPHRIRRIYNELKRLNVDEHPNATAVMLRVFIELSLDHYLDKKIGWPEPQIDNSFLAQKLTAAANHLASKAMMTNAQLEPVIKAASGQTLLAASVKTIHAYIHNRFFSPVASELKIAWDDLQPFIEKLWTP